MDRWHFVMYCVGVFVTCNFGWYLLRRIHDAVSAALTKRPKSAEAVDEEARYWPTDLAEDRRRFDELQRQIVHDAHPDDADAGKGGVTP